MTKLLRFSAALLAVGLACAALSRPVLAADLGGYERAPSMKDWQPQARPTIWSGFYLGANLGGGIGSVSDQDALDSIRTSGVVGGLHGGYNWQISNFVIGAEGDFDVSAMRGTRSIDGLAFTAQHRNFSSIRGRLGYSFGQMLVYGTAGYGWTNVNLSVSDGITTLGRSQTDGGFVYGGGIEYKLTRNLSMRGEALHFDTTGQWPTTDGTRATLNTPATEFRLGLTWHLN